MIRFFSYKSLLTITLVLLSIFLCLLTLLTGCHSLWRPTSDVNKNAPAKEKYLVFVITTKLYYLKYREDNPDENRLASLALSHAREMVMENYAMTSVDTDKLIAIGSANNWERIIEDRSDHYFWIMLASMSELNIIANQDSREPSFREIQSIAKMGAKNL